MRSSSHQARPASSFRAVKYRSSSDPARRLSHQSTDIAQHEFSSFVDRQRFVSEDVAPELRSGPAFFRCSSSRIGGIFPEFRLPVVHVKAFDLSVWRSVGWAPKSNDRLRHTHFHRANERAHGTGGPLAF